MYSPFLVLLSLLPFSLSSVSSRHEEIFGRSPGIKPTDRYVFAHFMIGIVSNRNSPQDYDADIKHAQATGIDAFALNIGTDDYSQTQLDYAYESAKNHGFKVFISFDCNYFRPGDESRMGTIIAKYATRNAQFLLDDGSVFVSTFVGDGLNIPNIRQAAGWEIYFAPNFHPDWPGSSLGGVDAAFNWMGWQSNGRNKAPSTVWGSDAVTVQDGDEMYLRALGCEYYEENSCYADDKVAARHSGSVPLASVDLLSRESSECCEDEDEEPDVIRRSTTSCRGYVAPISPWFFTHYGVEVPYSKNWVFPGDLLIYLRWLEILAFGPPFVELISWNDYGESHYFGPLSSKHTDDGASKWINDMPHVGWLSFIKPFIAAYKSSYTTVDRFIDHDQIIYWYRIIPRSVDCDSTDTTMGSANNDSGNFFQGRPNGYQTLEDNIFVVSLLMSPGTVTVNSGGTLYTFNAPSGASAFAVPFKIGSQRFALSRGGVEIIGETSLKEIQDSCPCGIYNFNPYVGVVPSSALGGGRDTLPEGDTAAYGLFTNGLKVPCEPRPSLASTPPTTTAVTTTVVATAASTSTPI